MKNSKLSYTHSTSPDTLTEKKLNNHIKTKETTSYQPKEKQLKRVTSNPLIKKLNQPKPSNNSPYPKFSSINSQTTFSSTEKSLTKALFLKKLKTPHKPRSNILKSSKDAKAQPGPITNLQKDFDHNFEIVNTSKTNFLNYSRFSILLQSLWFINNPHRKTIEERELILKA